MKKKIALLLVFCMCLTLLSGINVQRVKADVLADKFQVRIYADETDVPCDELSSAESLETVISSAAAIASGYSAGVPINVIIKLNTDIDISSSEYIEIPDMPNVQWDIKSIDTSLKKINCGSCFFYIYKGNNINFDYIKIDYSGSTNAVILQSSTGQSDGGSIIISNSVFNTVLSGSDATVRSTGSSLLIENSIISSSAIAIINSNTANMTILNSTIAAIGVAVSADCSSTTNASVYISGTTISSDGTAGVYLNKCKNSNIIGCTINTPAGNGIYASLNAGKTLTVDNCNITSLKNAGFFSMASNDCSVTIKNHCNLSSSDTSNSTVHVNGGLLNMEDSEVEYSGSGSNAVCLASDANANISRCTINSSHNGVKVDNESNGNVSISGCTINATGDGGVAVCADMSAVGEAEISSGCVITKTGTGSAIDVAMNGKLSIKDSTVKAESADGNGIATNNTKVSNIELNNCTVSAREGNTINLGKSKLISDGNVELRCGDDFSEGSGYTCLSVGLDGSNATDAGDGRTGAIDVRSGELKFIPFKGEGASSTSFAAIKVKGDQPVSISAIFSPTSECLFDESSYQDGIIYEPITNKTKETDPEPPAPSFTYFVVEKDSKVQISSKKDQKTVIVLDANEIDKLDLSKTDVIQIILKSDDTVGTSMGNGADIDLKLDFSVLPENIKSLKLNTGANLFEIDGVSKKNDTSLDLKLVEVNSRKLGADSTFGQPKEASNVIELDCRLNNKSSESEANVRIGAKINDVKTLSESDENKLPEDELSYSRIPDTFKKPVWVSMAEDGTIAKLDSKVVANSETGELVLEAEVPGVGTYGVMDETDADEIIRGREIAAAASSTFMIWTKASKNKHTINWNPVSVATKYKVYGAKGDGAYKKLGEVDYLDFLTFTNKNTGKDVWKYKVVAYAGKKKLGTSVVIYGAYDKNTKAVSKVTLPKTKKTLEVGKTYKLKPELTGTSPQAAVRYFSTNPMIAKVSKSGKITAVNEGVCEVFAYAANGYYRRIKITVK